MKTYSDLIQLESFLPIYDITDESSSNWRTFIPTPQFCDVLRKTLQAFTSAGKEKRKSMWVRGTFGTGKSHAASVIKHLLCDDWGQLTSYINKIEDISLKSQLANLREQQHFLPVVLKGVASAYDIPRFKLAIQRETQRALREAGISVAVQSDFEAAIAWIEKSALNRQRVEQLIEENDEIKIRTSMVDTMIDRLKAHDIEVYLALEKALQEDNVYFSQNDICKWLVEVEHEVESQGIADGMIVLWDEFTSVMDTLKSDRINVLQNLAELSRNNNVFLFLISHRTEEQSSDSRSADISVMSDRFEIMEYKMDEISTYLIMRHTFRMKDNPEAAALFRSAKQSRTKGFEELYQQLCSQNNASERQQISELFPLHPYTAYLCSKLSNYVGSTNRSVMCYMNDEKVGFRGFLDDEMAFENMQLLTADSLWDFFFERFDRDAKCGTCISIYNQFINQLEGKGGAYARVFKVVILLNALMAQQNDRHIADRLKPNQSNLELIFRGDTIADEIPAILDYLNDSQIVSRDPFGVFRIAANNYNAEERNEERFKQAAMYKDALKFYKVYQDACETLRKENPMEAIFTVGKNIVRKCSPAFYACEEKVEVLNSYVRKYEADKPNQLHVAILLSIEESGINYMDSQLMELSTKYPRVIFLLSEEPLGKDKQNKIIDFKTDAALAARHKDDTSDFNKQAFALAIQWMNQVQNGRYAIFFNGERMNEGILKNVGQVINEKLSRRLFPKGFEMVPVYNGKTKINFFLEAKNLCKTAQDVIKARYRDDLLNFNGAHEPAKSIFLDATGNNLVDEMCEMNEAEYNGGSWLAEVCRKVDDCIEKAKNKYSDAFYISEILSPLMQAPYGFGASPANWIALAFALRKHKKDLFVPGTSQPISNEALYTDVLCTLFKMWGDGKSENNSKLRLRFGSPEESRLTKQLDSVFDLHNIPSVGEVNSYQHAKYGIQEYCKTKAKYPLWTLTYCSGVKDDIMNAILSLIKLMSQESPSVEDIKKLSNTINPIQHDMMLFVLDVDKYEEGFRAFVDSIENIAVLPEWWDDMLTDISYMPSEVAFRKEEDVKNRILNFYIKKTKPQTPYKPIEPVIDACDRVSELQPTPLAPVVDKQDTKKAVERVQTTNMPNLMWQKLMLDLLEEYPQVSKYIANYLS